MNFSQWFNEKYPGIKNTEVVLKMHEEGATVPFMARYRKEQTGNLDEVAIAAIIAGKEIWDHILQRQKFIIEEIARQEKLTGDLEKKIRATFDADRLEDIYLPYKQKRKTKAALAREAGLEPLANLIWDSARDAHVWPQGETLENLAKGYINENGKIKNPEDAVSGAQDILTEKITEAQEIREKVRALFFSKGVLSARKNEAQPNSKFERYFEYNESVTTLMKPENSHRYLAMKRGWTEKELSLSFSSGEDESLLAEVIRYACPLELAPGKQVLTMAARLALKVYIQPSIENELHRELKNVADTAAIKVFAENVRKLLLAAPFGVRPVLGIDPGIRTGCKAVVISSTGAVISHTVLYLQSESEKKQSQDKILAAIKAAGIAAVAIGNGTASRETESFVRKVLEGAKITLPVVVVSESGASIYSASDVAREEFPDLDVTVRGAISIARRFQDPLAEFVKVDAKSIGVGQYQHDVNQAQLKKNLDLVVDSCVNQVGANVNTASYHLLSHVSGIGPGLAKAIVSYREKNGEFKSRDELLKVPRFTSKVFEQAAGFLRIPGGTNPLDNTAVHPERYSMLQEWAKKLGKDIGSLLGSGVSVLKSARELRKEAGEYTFDDIIAELEKPGLDPRDKFELVSFRDDIHEVKDLKEDMVCPGVVTNVTNFGAFVDIGVHQDGLVHISQLADRFVKDPRDVVSPGDRVTVRVLSVDLAKKQIALTMKSPAQARKTREESITHAKSNSQQIVKNPHAYSTPKTPFNNPFAVLGTQKK